jgi:hypothetical protein
MSTTFEQLEGATLSLVRSGAIKDRLADAYRNHLALLNAEDLPEGLRAEFRACDAALTRERPQRGEDAVRATVRKMSTHEADELACSVVRLFAAVVREATREAELPEVVLHGVTAAGSRPNMLKGVPQVVPLYAAEA